MIENKSRAIPAFGFGSGRRPAILINPTESAVSTKILGGLPDKGRIQIMQFTHFLTAKTLISDLNNLC